MQSTVFSVYRRNATVSSSRATSALLSVLDVGPPEVQNITPAEFYVAFDNLLYLFNSTGTGYDFCRKVESAALLTQHLFITLVTSYAVQTFTPAVDYLRNMIGTILYYFNTMTSGLLPGGGFANPSINTIQDGLPSENLVNGSLARQVHYVAPEPWTIYAYLGVSGMFVLLVCAGYLWTISFKLPRTPALPLLDSLRLRLEYPLQAPQPSVYPGGDWRNVFKGTNINNDREAIRAAQAIVVHLKPEQFTDGASEPNSAVDEHHERE